MTQESRGRRQGVNFTTRIAPRDRSVLERMCAKDDGPKRLGPYLVWKALGTAAAATLEQAVPARARRGEAVPRRRGTAGSSPPAPALPKIKERVILDLCAGSGSWSEPYKRAGYRVKRITWPKHDVRTFQVPSEAVWGVLAAPPCTEFSLAKNGHERDFVEGMACVNACLRIILQARPQWWALENPVGLLSRWLGTPALVFEPHEFGDPWTKRTAIWGSFALPKRGPFVKPVSGGGPICALCFPDAPRSCSVADHRAITPGGFARSFFEANP